MDETEIYLDLAHLRQRLLVFENGMHDGFSDSG